MVARNMIDGTVVADRRSHDGDIGTAMFPRPHPGLNHAATPPPAPPEREFR
jgi:hypothetical protein